MWASALQQLRDYIASAGGRVVDSIVLMDLAPPWTTFITTPVWMLTGKKKLAGFPEAGIQTEDFERLEGFGKKLALQKEHWAEGQCFLAGDSSVALAEKYIFPEIVVKNLVFKPWAALIHLAEPLGLGFKNFLVGCFILALLGSILVLIPLILVSKMFLKIFVGNFLKKLKAQALYPYDS